jgi:hypothetical protein
VWKKGTQIHGEHLQDDRRMEKAFSPAGKSVDISSVKGKK